LAVAEGVAKAAGATAAEITGPAACAANAIRFTGAADSLGAKAAGARNVATAAKPGRQSANVPTAGGVGHAKIRRIAGAGLAQAAVHPFHADAAAKSIAAALGVGGAGGPKSPFAQTGAFITNQPLLALNPLTAVKKGRPNGRDRGRDGGRGGGRAEAPPKQEKNGDSGPQEEKDNDGHNVARIGGHLLCGLFLPSVAVLPFLSFSSAPSARDASPRKSLEGKV
jgi:hypothetical protein